MELSEQMAFQGRLLCFLKPAVTSRLRFSGAVPIHYTRFAVICRSMP